MANDFVEWDWNCDSVDAHRRGINDIEWARQQGEGNSKHKLGDVIEFKVGGFGVITTVSEAKDGWPVSYSTRKIDGKPFHARNKCAWHYDGDIK